MTAPNGAPHRPARRDPHSRARKLTHEQPPCWYFLGLGRRFARKSPIKNENLPFFSSNQRPSAQISVPLLAFGSTAKIVSSEALPILQRNRPAAALILICH
jgi:hypothetical protein